MKKHFTYNELYPSGLGIFHDQRERLDRCPLGGVKAEFEKAVHEKYITMKQAAAEIPCSYGTIRKRFKEARYMMIENQPHFTRHYYFRLDVDPIIEALKASQKKRAEIKEKKRDSFGVSRMGFRR